jgi:hypothetical protein
VTTSTCTTVTFFCYFVIDLPAGTDGIIDAVTSNHGRVPALSGGLAAPIFLYHCKSKEQTEEAEVKYSLCRVVHEKGIGNSIEGSRKKKSATWHFFLLVVVDC